MAPPPAYVDPSDPTTFPARYVQESPARFGKCDASGCAVAVTIRNVAGPPAGKSSVTIKIRGADDAELGSCSADLPAIEYQQAQEVSCTVSGGGWTNFYNNSADRRYFARVSIQNPPYDAG